MSFLEQQKIWTPQNVIIVSDLISEIPFDLIDHLWLHHFHSVTDF